MNKLPGLEDLFNRRVNQLVQQIEETVCNTYMGPQEKCIIREIGKKLIKYPLIDMMRKVVEVFNERNGPTWSLKVVQHYFRGPCEPRSFPLAEAYFEIGVVDAHHQIVDFGEG
jgi:hypothetical protein